MPGVETFVFYGLAALILGGAGGVAFSRNILHAAFLLLLTLSGTAGLYFFLGADFVGVAQILIYVGGILVLLLFAVLLTNRIGEVRMSNRNVGYLTAGPLVLLVAAFLTSAMALGTWAHTEAVAAPTTARLGEAFLREFLLPFELVSLVLLMALVGAMVVARRAVRDRGDASEGALPAEAVSGPASLGIGGKP